MIPVIDVANDGVPVPLVTRPNVTVNEPVAPPSVAFAVPDNVNVAVSLSVMLMPSVVVEFTPGGDGSTSPFEPHQLAFDTSGFVQMELLGLEPSEE